MDSAGQPQCSRQCSHAAMDGQPSLAWPATREASTFSPPNFFPFTNHIISQQQHAQQHGPVQITITRFNWVFYHLEFSALCIAHLRTVCVLPSPTSRLPIMASSSRSGGEHRPVHQDYVARIRYSNALPPPPNPPKLLDIPNTGLASGQYTAPGFASRLAREQPLNIEADAELGMPLDLIGMPGIFDGDESCRNSSPIFSSIGAIPS